MTRYYALAERPYITDETGGYYGLPEGTIGSVDLAPYGAHNYVFVTSDKPFNSNDIALALGDGTRLNEYRLGKSEMSGWETLLGVTYQTGWTLLDALWGILTIDSDPDGEVRCKPLVPTHKGILELHLGGHSCIRRQKMPKNIIDLPHWPQLQRLLQNSQKRNKKQARGDEHLKQLGATARKYRLSGDAVSQLIGGGDRAKKPTTLIRDDFESDTISTDYTIIDNGTWVWYSSGQEVRGRSDAAMYGPSLRHDTQLSSDDHYCEALFAWQRHNSELSVCVRVPSGSSPSIDGYSGRTRSTGLQINRYINGNRTTIADNDNGMGEPVVIRLTADGSNVIFELPEDDIVLSTDTQIEGNMNTALGSHSFDALPSYNAGAGNFEAADLLAFNPAWAANNNQFLGAV